MLSVDQAIEAILSRCRVLASRPTRLIDALGLILDEPIVADIDLPPFDKALMDGYAVRSGDLGAGVEFRLSVSDEILAGRMPTRPVRVGEAARIMTGAPLPSGADAVVPFEQTRLEGTHVILSGPVSSGSNRLTRGREMKAGDRLLEPGTRLGASTLGLIASSGRAEVSSIPRPTIAVVPTGDELIPVAEVPGPGQIRNSNGVMLAGLARSWGATEVREGSVARDDPAELRRGFAGQLGIGLGDRSPIEPVDVLLISGGVSAGTRDLVPSTLVDLGVEPVFHKVHVKPGKPLWFGVGPPRGEKTGTLVFGLPGNPVSGVVGFLLFVRPALEALAGGDPKRTQLASFALGVRFHHKGDRPTYHPTRLVDGLVFPMEWAGSSDLRTLALADGFASFPPGDRIYEAGEPISYLPL